MSEKISTLIEDTYATPVPDYFKFNGWFTENAHGHKNRAFISWAFSGTRCCQHYQEHDGKKIILEPLEFLYSHELCLRQCGIAKQASNDRLDRAKNEGVLVKVRGSSNLKYSIYKWVPDAFKVMNRKKSHGKSHGISSEKQTKKSHGKSHGDEKKATEKATEKATLLKQCRFAPNNDYVKDNVFRTEVVEEGAIEAKKFNLSNEQKVVLSWLIEKKIKTEKETLSFWAKTYSFGRLQDVFEDTVKKSDSNPGGYMNSMLRKGLRCPSQNERTNQGIALKFKAENKWHDLKIEEYCVSLVSSRGHNKEYKTSSNPIDFYADLYDLYEWHLQNL